HRSEMEGQDRSRAPGILRLRRHLGGDVEKLYGWDFFEKLAKNNPQVGRSINDTVTMLNAGERIIAGSGPVGTAMESAAKGNPLAMTYPTDGSVLIIAPSGIPKGVKHPNAAKLFMEYL